MKRVLAFLFVFNFLLLFTGCANQRELNEIGIVMAMAVDKENDNWAVTYQIVIPRAIASQAQGSGASNLPPVTTFTTYGSTLYEAIANISMERPRIPIFSHNRVFIISEKVAREEGVSQIIDYCIRDQEIRVTTSLILSKKPAKELLELLLPTENLPSNAIREILDRGHEMSSFTRNVDVHDFVESIASPTGSAVVPEIMVSGERGPQSTLDGLKRIRIAASLRLGDLGVFNKDKLVGWFDQEASTGLAFITNKAKGLSIVFGREGGDGREAQSSYQMLKASSSLKPQIKDGRITMQLEIKTSGVLKETTNNLDLTKPDSIRKLEDSISKQIINQVNYAWEKTKELQVDAAGFGNEIYKKYPKEWKVMKPDWNRLFTEIELKTTVKVDMEHTGLVGKSFSTLLKD